MKSKQIKIGITEASGFLGTHVQWYFFKDRENVEIIDLKDNFTRIAECNVVLHLFSANGSNTEKEEVYSKNIEKAEELLLACDEANTTPYIIYASSTHIFRDNSYGKSKRAVGELFRKWGEKKLVPITNLIIPNEFGEGCEPFSVSVVSTFCHQLIAGEKVSVNREASVELIHAQEIASCIDGLIKFPKDEDLTLNGTTIKIEELYELLKNFKESYFNGIIPSLESPLHLALFNTLRAHIFLEGTYYPRQFKLHEDDRGSLFEIIKEKTGGQTFISTTKPGITRGEHYHTRKIERFCVLKGEALVEVRDILSDKVISFNLSGDKPSYVDMPTFFTHNIKNTGDSDLVTAFWSNEIFNPDDTDTHLEKV